MELLAPDWKQPRPTAAEVREMCLRIQLAPVNLPSHPFDRLLASIRKSHVNGGVFLAAFDVGSDRVFDWFASRNRLQEEGLLDCLLGHSVIRETLDDLLIPDSEKIKSGLAGSDQFLFDGALSQILYYGGAYSVQQGDGRAEKEFSLEVCNAMFGLRFGEINCYLSHVAWAPWFKGIAWDLTAVVFDSRMRRLWILTVTDTD